MEKYENHRLVFESSHRCCVNLATFSLSSVLTSHYSPLFFFCAEPQPIGFTVDIEVAEHDSKLVALVKSTLEVQAESDLSHESSTKLGKVNIAELDFIDLRRGSIDFHQKSFAAVSSLVAAKKNEFLNCETRNKFSCFFELRAVERHLLLQLVGELCKSFVKLTKYKTF